MRFHLLSATLLSILLTSPVTAQQTAAGKQPGSVAQNGSELRYVVYLSRHGVRSPTGQTSQYNRFSAAPWPEWSVPPGYLTPHGFHLMELFGVYDRQQLANQGLLGSDGCADASRVLIYADSDQRTRETGKAIAQGLMPGCTLPVQFLPQGTRDPLFHPDTQTLASPSAHDDAALVLGAIAGRIGGDPANLTQAYYPQIAALDHILATCGIAQSSPRPLEPQRTSLLDVPASLTAGNGDHAVELKGPLFDRLNALGESSTRICRGDGERERRLGLR